MNLPILDGFMLHTVNDVGELKVLHSIFYKRAGSKLDKETIITMYNELNEYLGLVERALDMREHELDILMGVEEDIPLE